MTRDQRQQWKRDGYVALLCGPDGWAYARVPVVVLIGQSITERAAVAVRRAIEDGAVTPATVAVVAAAVDLSPSVLSGVDYQHVMVRAWPMEGA